MAIFLLLTVLCISKDILVPVKMVNRFKPIIDWSAPESSIYVKLLLEKVLQIGNIINEKKGY